MSARSLATMSPADLCSALEWAEVSASYPADMRQVLRDERQSLAIALRSRDGAKIAAATAEAKRVARMWGLT